MQTNSIQCQSIIQLSSLIGEFNLETGPWIAGGTARRLWYGEPWEKYDIDIFFQNQLAFNNTVNALHSLLDCKNRAVALLQHKSKNAILYNIDFRNIYQSSVNFLQVQAIRLNFYNNLKEVFDDFDLTICKFATDGITCIASDDALQDCKDNVIRINESSTKKLKASRIIKYSDYGFDADERIMKELLKQYRNNELDVEYDYQ